MADTDDLPIMPDGVPCPYVSDYAITTTNPLQATTMTSGRVRVRERWHNVPQQVALTYRLDDSQAQLLEGFLKHECRNGAAPFKQSLRFPRSKKLQRYVVQLTEMYSGPSWVESSLGIWEVTYTAYTMEDERPTEDEYMSTMLGGITPEEAIEALDYGELPEDYYILPDSGGEVTEIDSA